MSLSKPPGPLALVRIPRRLVAGSARVPRQLATGSARAIRTASPQALERLLRSPARPMVLDALFWHVGRRLARRASSPGTWTVRCYVTRTAGQEPDIYELRSRGGRCQVSRGTREAKPEVTVALDDAELVRLITGQSTPAQGVFNGRIMVRGDVGKGAAALASVFRARSPD